MDVSYLEYKKIIKMKTHQDVQASKWPDLPKDVLLSILRFLNLKIDLPRLRGVCTAWRSCLPEPARQPCTRRLQVPSLLEFSYGPLFIVESKFYLVSPLLPRDEAGDAASVVAPTRWITRMVEEEYNKWRLLNPLETKDLLLTVPPVTGTINLCDCRVVELSTAYSLVYDSREKSVVVSEKVVVLSKFNLEENDSSDVVLALIGGQLFLWRTGDKYWTEIGGGEYSFLDVTSYQGKFYAFDWNMRKLVIIDPATSVDTLLIESIDCPIPSDSQGLHFDLHFNENNVNSLHLVTSSDDCLYQVIKVKVGGKYTVVVLTLKEEMLQKTSDTVIWEYVESLGNQIFFIGNGVSFSLPSSTEHLPQWKPSSICLFSKPVPRVIQSRAIDMVRGAVGLELVGLEQVRFMECYRYIEIFDMEKMYVTSFKELPKLMYAGVFFPPPPWVRWHCPKLSNVEINLHDFVMSL